MIYPTLEMSFHDFYYSFYYISLFKFYFFNDMETNEIFFSFYRMPPIIQIAFLKRFFSHAKRNCLKKRYLKMALNTLLDFSYELCINLNR